MIHEDYYFVVVFDVPCIIQYFDPPVNSIIRIIFGDNDFHKYPEYKDYEILEHLGNLSKIQGNRHRIMRTEWEQILKEKYPEFFI